MKRSKGSLAHQLREQPVWCDLCCLRIAPYDQYVTLGGKLYHPACHARLLRAKKQARES